MSHTPLSDKDYQTLSDTLARFQAQGAMNLERLDGFFTALLAGPEPLKPQDCLPAILGEAFDDEDAFPSVKSLERFVSLLMGHWLDIAHTLKSAEPVLPWLDDGDHAGNEWAQGFMEGMALFNDDWGLLFDDTDHADALAPIMALAFEHHPDPEMRPFIGDDPARREEWLAALSDSIGRIHSFFESLRQSLDDGE
ncbi:UPF0149 family protein [Paludibacterium paludis]|uniref:YecA family protein n=1 Tax=Paludibacterium paludis TaxID=1225769 RepID=A0A918P006_9NEIS|nr:UPF0149 family protein [Paludibacterium paludis]GGY10877.1 hypothetical protein GCM10011289_12110 [Paludibacterium paludis]